MKSIEKADDYRIDKENTNKLSKDEHCSVNKIYRRTHYNLTLSPAQLAAEQPTRR